MEDTREDWPGRALILQALELLDDIANDDNARLDTIELDKARQKLACWLGYHENQDTNRYQKDEPL